MVPSVDVIEDKDGYHFYFEMPGLTNESIDARIENGRLLVAAERKRPEWPQETEVHIAEQLRCHSSGVRAAQRREPRRDRGQLQGRRARGDGREEAGVQIGENPNQLS
jgi:hypothetical protein